MPPHDPDILLHGKKWMVIADEDLRLAKFGITLFSGCPYRLIAQCCFQ